MSLEKKVRVKVGGEVGGDELGVLATGLLSSLFIPVSSFGTNDERKKQMKERLTTTVPLPHLPFQCPLM